MEKKNRKIDRIIMLLLASLTLRYSAPSSKQPKFGSIRSSIRIGSRSINYDDALNETHILIVSPQIDTFSHQQPTNCFTAALSLSQFCTGSALPSQFNATVPRLSTRSSALSPHSLDPLVKKTTATTTLHGHLSAKA